jgi:hypothetical protein
MGLGFVRQICIFAIRRAGKWPSIWWAALGAKLAQLGEGTGILTIVSRLITVHDVERAGVVAHETKREDGGDAGIIVVILSGDFKVESGGFHCPDPHETPAADSHGVDEIGLGARLGIEFVLQFGKQFEEPGGGLGFENDDGCLQPVKEGVVGRPQFALGRDRPAGSGAIGAGRGDLLW